MCSILFFFHIFTFFDIAHIKYMHKIGIFGGSFNPIHIAHLVIAEHFVEKCALEMCFFVPTSLSPFKANFNNDFESISHTHRLDILQLSISYNKKFRIDTYEIEKGGISYSIDTINHFTKRFADEEIMFLIGYDQAKSFHQWKNWEQILDISQIVIADRPDYESSSDKDEINERLALYGKSPIWLENPLIDISSSEIRRRIKNGLSVKYLIMEKAEAYINAYKIYQ